MAEPAHAIYPTFDTDFGMNLYPEWVFQPSYGYPTMPNTQPQPEVQRSPTNTASTHSSGLSVGASGDEGWFGRGGGGGTTSDGSRTSVSGRSGHSRRSEKRKREVVEQHQQQENVPPSHWAMPQMNAAGPSNSIVQVQASRHRSTRDRPTHNPYKWVLRFLITPWSAHDVPGMSHCLRSSYMLRLSVPKCSRQSKTRLSAFRL